MGFSKQKTSMRNYFSKSRIRFCKSVEGPWSGFVLDDIDIAESTGVVSNREIAMRHIASAVILIQMLIAFVTVEAQAASTWQAKLDAVLALGKTEKRQVVRDKLISLSEQLTKSLPKHPKDADLRAVLGDTHAYLGQNTKAMKYLGQAVEMSPKNAEFVYLRGVIYEQSLREPDKAVADYAKAFELAPQRIGYALATVKLLRRLKRPEEAATLLKRAERIKGLSGASCINIGAEWCALNREDMGLKAFQQALLLDPKLFNAHANIGQLLQNAGKYAESLKAYQKVLKLRPENWRAVAKTIQLNQALQRIPARDAAIKRMRKLYDAGKVDKPLFCRDQFKHSGKNVMVFEYFKLEGDRPLLYVFQVIDPKTGGIVLRYSLGSYAITNSIARETGGLKKGQRMFHLDRYTPNGAHLTYGMYVDPKQITYDVVRKRVVAAMDGKLRPRSGTSPRSDK